MVTIANHRIALFFPNLAAGGVQRSFLLLAEGLLQAGLDVDLVVGSARGPLKERVPSGARLVDLQAGHIRAALPGLVKYLKEVAPDAVLSAQTHANILAVWAVRLAGTHTRLVVSEHNDMASVVHASRKESFRPLLARLFYPWADSIVAVSRGAADSLSQMTGIPRDSIHVIYNPIVPDDLGDHRREPANHPWFSDTGPPVVLAVGRLAKQKDYPCLLRAVARLRQDRPVRLLILGEGPERHMLEGMINRMGMDALVDLPGYAENVYSFMARASVFVLSSAWEGFPSVLVEAMACGVPVISTNCPSGPAEILENGQYGCLVPVGDSIAMAGAIEQTLSRRTRDEKAMLRGLQFNIGRAVRSYMPILFGVKQS